MTAPLLALCACAIGEYCATGSPACWPCAANHFCRNGIQTPCPNGQWSLARSGECRPCPPGMECGTTLRRCGLGTFSPENRSRCDPCTECKELTLQRCNATHDSVCGKARSPIAVVRIHQEFRTAVHAEVFGVFAMIYASTLPKSRLMQICDAERCVDCFQGVCPVAKLQRLEGPAYRTTIEIRSDAHRLQHNVHSLTQSAFLQETAKDTMRKLTDTPFVAYARVEHNVICPEGLVWEQDECVKPAEDLEGNPRT